MTRLLLVTTVAVFLAQVFSRYVYGIDFVGNRLELSREAWATHDYGTLLSYAWAHAVEFPPLPGFFWLHIVTNMMLVYSLGPNLELALGWWRFLLLYLGGAVAAGATWLVFNSQPGESVVGASGAAFALIAAAGTLAPGARVLLVFPVKLPKFLLRAARRLYIPAFFLRPIPVRLGVLAFSLCAVEVASIIFGWMPYVGHTAHLGGAVFGFLYCLALRGIRRWQHRRLIKPATDVS